MAAKAHVISTAFLGNNLQCARCHDAPYHPFKQSDLFGMAAMLKNETIKVPSSSSVVLPTAGAFGFGVKPGWTLEMITSVLWHAIMPAASIVLTSIGFWGLGMRGMMITTMGEDYMKFAEYKGLKDRRVFLSYGVRNALLPQVTGLAISLGTILAGSVLVEVIFAYPGLGNLLYRAITSNDYFLLQGIILFIIVSLGFSLFLIDLIYPLVDPRIKLEGGENG